MLAYNGRELKILKCATISIDPGCRAMVSFISRDVHEGQKTCMCQIITILNCLNIEFKHILYVNIVSDKIAYQKYDQERDVRGKTRRGI